MLLLDQLAHNLGELGISRTASHARSANNQRRPGFVNQNRIHFVDNSIVQITLAQLVFLAHHIVTQVVETELIICSISNVSRVSLLTSRRPKMTKTLILMLLISKLRIIYIR